MTQFLTGHGSFGSFTKRIGKTQSDVCKLCGVRDDPEHFYGFCQRWETKRKEIIDRLGYLPDVEELIPKMLESKEMWQVLFKFIAETMENKEIEDREEGERARTA